MENSKILQDKIQKFRKKFLSKLMLKGFSLFGLLVITTFIVFNFVEYVAFFSKPIRAGLFFTFIALFGASLYNFVLKPYLKFRKNSSDENIAREIGKSMPGVKDKLLNTILLIKNHDDGLAAASIEQRAFGFTAVEFDKSIRLRETFKYLMYFGFIALFLLSFYLYKPLIFSGSTSRIINFNQEYKEPAAFALTISNNDLQVFESEEFKLDINVEGKTVPNAIYIVENGLRHKATFDKETGYSYVFTNISKDKNFKLEAAGIESPEYNLEVLKRPSITKTNIYAHYPKYINLKNESFNGVNEINIPEGTTLDWEFLTRETESISLNSASNINYTVNEKNDGFQTSMRYKTSDLVTLKLTNLNGDNKEKIAYNINVIKDLSPRINLISHVDTVLYEYISLAGNVSDDYGIKSLVLKYRVIDTKQPVKDQQAYTSINIPVNKSIEQSYFYNWDIDQLITKDASLEYYLQVWDNDGVNGSKSTKTAVVKLESAKSNNAKEQIGKTNESVENNIEKNVDEVKELRDKINETKEKLRSKKNLNWQDKNELEKIAQKQNALQKSIEELSKEFDKLKKQQDKFDKQDEPLSEKADELQKMLDEMMDEETKKMFKELEKMLEKKDIKPEKITSLLEEMEKKDFNLEKELERAKNLFNKLKFEEKLDKTIAKLEELAKKQDELAEENKENKLDTEEAKKDASEKQDEINKEFEDVKKDLEELEELNKDAKTGFEEKMKENKELSEDIKKEQQEASEDLKSGKSKPGSEKQSSSSEKMKKMGESMMGMQKQMGEEQNQEDLKNLRRILNNLIKVSYDQEELRNKFKTIRTVNPQFVEHSSKQLKIREDTQVIEDSLLALAGRNFQIKSYVTKELFSMNEYLDKSLQSIRDRKVGQITKNQQFSIEHINNLALMLSEVMEQMQQQQAQEMEGEQMCNNPKPNGGKPKPSMQMGKQQQKLSQQIMQLKQSGKSGKEMSESLAKMASQQEQLRKQLKELGKMQDKGKGKGQGGELGKLDKLMEENEIDLLNKRLTQETMKRQKDIITRLLEAEKAMRERDWDKDRESKTAKQFDRDLPPSFEKYLKEKEKQTEILKTVNPAFVPYYKQEINEYLREL